MSTAWIDSAQAHTPDSNPSLRERIYGKLNNHKFALHYQPPLAKRTRRMQGTEALLRWNNTLLGSVPPAHFIGLAKETGLIKAIGL